MTTLRRLLVLLLLVPALASGCSALEEHKDECMSNCMDRCEAWKAWWRVKHCYANEPYYCEFGEGFRDGYIHILNGGNGCPPLLAPRKYWSSCCYRGCEGQAASLAWFNGYSQGVLQALYEGVAGCNGIVTSRDLYGTQCQEAIDITAMMEACRHAPLTDPHLHPHGPTNCPCEPGQGPIEWTPQPLPQDAYDNLQGADEIWDNNLFEPAANEQYEPPILEPVEQLPTSHTEDAVSPALIEFLDPFEATE